MQRYLAHGLFSTLQSCSASDASPEKPAMTPFNEALSRNKIKGFRSKLDLTGAQFLVAQVSGLPVRGCPFQRASNPTVEGCEIGG